MALIAGLLLVIVWGAAIVASNKSMQLAGLRSMQHLPKKDATQKLLVLPFRYAIDRAELFERMQPFLATFHGKLLILNGSSWTIEKTRMAFSAAVGQGYAAMTAGSILAVLSDESALLYLGALLGVIIPIARWQEATRKVERRKQDILLLLPDVLSKLMLLLGAGETLQQALYRCAEPNDGHAHPLLNELRRACEGIRNGESFPVAMEGFSRRCGVQEVSLFTTTLLLNYRRGGDKLVLSLKELTYTLWEKRKAIARTRGEEASSKLIFPVVGIFVVLMILVASPAMLSFSW